MAGFLLVCHLSDNASISTPASTAAKPKEPWQALGPVLRSLSPDQTKPSQTKPTETNGHQTNRHQATCWPPSQRSLPDGRQALYRRGLAQLGAGEAKLARSDLAAAARLEPRRRLPPRAVGWRMGRWGGGASGAQKVVDGMGGRACENSRMAMGEDKVEDEVEVGVDQCHFVGMMGLYKRRGKSGWGALETISS